MTDIKEFWLNANGKEVLINGIKHILRVSVYRAIYPYEHQVLTVHAEPKNKNTEYYQATKKELGDDWSTDVLGSFEIECDVMAQLGRN